MARNTATQRFRDTANDDEWIQMVQDHESFSKEDFESKYNFSWSSIMNDAVNRGLYEKKRIHSSPTPQLLNPDGTELFYVKDQPADRKKISRSVQLDQNIYERLQALERDKGQYTHSSILNQLLDDALAKYGY